MAVNRGKDFEDCIRDAFNSVPDTFCLRLIDPQAGYSGVFNICDFIVHHTPCTYFIECKSCHGNTLPIYSNNPKKKYGNISNGQWEGLLQASECAGTVCGYMIWFIDHDKTIFVTSEQMKQLRDSGAKSLNIKNANNYFNIKGNKKRVYFDYDLSEFLNTYS